MDASLKWSVLRDMYIEGVDIVYVYIYVYAHRYSFWITILCIPTLGNFNSATPHLRGCFCPWTLF